MTAHEMVADVVTPHAMVADQVRRGAVAMLYRYIARTYYRDAELAFEAGWEAVGVVALLTARRLERSAEMEIKNPKPEGLA